MWMCVIYVSVCAFVHGHVHSGVCVRVGVEIDISEFAIALHPNF